LKKEEYKIMFAAEEHHWWYRGLRKILFSSINKYLPLSKAQVLDVGCGTGLLLKIFSKKHEIKGVDYSEEAISFCRLRGLKSLIKASVNELPFENNSFDLITCMDVLYHKGIDIRKSLSEIYRVLKPGGIFAINIPAFNFLYSSHDRAIETARRFTKKELKNLLKGNGFAIFKFSY
jgi:ubiquinone/menaquinone biosynthesis C-methylase UbiE